MKNWLITILGGVTKEAYDLLNKEYEQQRNLVIALRERDIQIQKECEQERAERKELQQIIFKNYGVTFIDESQEFSKQDHEQLRPIGNARERWSGLRARLESDDRARIKGKTGEKSETA